MGVCDGDFFDSDAGACRRVFVLDALWLDSASARISGHWYTACRLDRGHWQMFVRARI